MKFFLRIVLIILPIFLTSCKDKGAESQYNPLLAEWSNPNGMPLLAEIEPQHFAAAMTQALAEHSQEIEAIANNSEPATYENTALALEVSGRRLADLTATLRLLAENMGGEYVEVAKEWLPTVEAHYIRVAQNQPLFTRLSTLNRGRALLSDSLQRRVVERLHRKGVKSGAALEEDGRKRVVEIDSLLMLSSLEYADRVTKAEDEYRMLLKSEQLIGIPVSERNISKSLAVAEGFEERWLYTTHPESAEIMLSTAEEDTLRNQLYAAYINKGITPEADNRKLAAEMVALRAERAALLGYRDYRQMVADGEQSQDVRTAERVVDSLRREMPASLKISLERLNKINVRIQDTTLFSAADMLYMQERVRDEYAALTIDDVTPYLPLENVRLGAFWLANRLYGLTFTPLSLNSYSYEVTSYSVADFDGRQLGVLLFDPYSREGKLSGMRTLEVMAPRMVNDTLRQGAVVALSASFRHSDSQPTTLTPWQAREIFGEMGKAIAIFLAGHDLPSLRKWDSDYAALPELVMEQWALRTKLLSNYALHYSSGTLLESNVMRKVQVADTLDSKIAFARRLAFADVDRELHSSATADVTAATRNHSVAEGIAPLYGEGAMMPLFADGSPDAGRYGDRLWAEMVAADIFYTFSQSGDIVEKASARRLRTLLEMGGAWDAEVLYRDFKGDDVNYLPWLVGVGFADESILLPPEPEEEEQVVGVDNNYRVIRSRRDRDDEPEERPSRPLRPRTIRPTRNASGEVEL